MVVGFSRVCGLSSCCWLCCRCRDDRGRGSYLLCEPAAHKVAFSFPAVLCRGLVATQMIGGLFSACWRADNTVGRATSDSSVSCTWLRTNARDFFTCFRVDGISPVDEQVVDFSPRVCHLESCWDGHPYQDKRAARSLAAQHADVVGGIRTCGNSFVTQQPPECGTRYLLRVTK